MLARRCIVSFTDTDRITHSVKVHAETLYEAAVLAISSFKEYGCPPGSASVLQIEIQAPAITHTVVVRKIHDWLNGSCKSPNEKSTKERLKGLLDRQSSRPTP